MTARTSPPTDGFDTYERFSERLDGKDAACVDCGAVELDVWITEGGTAARTVCVNCGHEHDDEVARRLYEGEGA